MCGAQKRGRTVLGDAVMPKGVEHLDFQDATSPPPRLGDAVMPKGVEHDRLEVNDAATYPRRRGDAERR